MAVERLESAGSVWFVDVDARRYCRFPRAEAPRERPEWGDERAGPLQDAVWHPFTGRWWRTNQDLLIELSPPVGERKAGNCIRAPLPYEDTIPL